MQERHTAPVGDRVGFFARNDEYGEAARKNGGRGPEKYPQLLGKAQKSRGPWPKGGNFLGKRALPAPAAAGGHAQNLQMLTI